METADLSFDGGCYVCLTEAYQLYEKLQSHPLDQGAAKEKLFRTSLLLRLREKELGILESPYYDRASALSPDPLSAYLSLCLEIVSSTFAGTRGLDDDRLEERFATMRRLRKLEDDHESMRLLKQQAEVHVFGAYIYISLMNSLNAFKGEELGPQISSFIEAHSESPPLLYKYAVSTGSERDLLEQVLSLEPRFHESYFFLGKAALKAGNLYGGEAHLAKAHKHFPDSLPIVTELAETVYQMGEMEQSLAFYDKALALAPSDRDALLGKAICLGFLRRPHDAMLVLHEMIDLGKWYLGEAHYWLAWNEHELGHLETAVGYVEQAKKYIPMDTEARTLSGIIAFEQDRFEDAIHELERAKKYDTYKSNCEAPFHLGMIYSRRQEWESSGTNFERAGTCHSKEVRALEAMIFNIEASSLAAERKQRLIFQREAQRREAAINEATAFYNAAAGYFNVGMDEQAWNCAINASQHDYFKEKASDLIEKIREIPKKP
jgi:tetratricopeptide (TPR) repeat protein